MNHENNWQKYKIKDITTSFSGGTPLTDHPEFYEGGDIPFITSSDLNQSFITAIPHVITQKGLQKSSAKMVPENTLLFALYGATAGTCALTGTSGAINQAILALVDCKVEKKLLYYTFCWKKNYILHTYTQGGQPNLSSQIIGNLSFAFPKSRQEQQKIVAVLETWDKAIGLTKRLIEQKELQKKYLMQQLLTGRTRLKGFTYEWKESRLNKIKEVVIEKGKPLTKQQLKPGTIPVIAGGQDIPYYHNCWTHDFPCITISASGAYAGFVWIHHEKIWASDCNVLYCTEYDLNFLYFCLKYQQGRLFYLQTGGAQGHVYAGEIGSLLLPNIPLKEQQAIANVLSSCDKGIDLLKQKLAKLEEQKKGLMQVLLTGKVRLK